MIKLTDILREVGETTATSYSRTKSNMAVMPLPSRTDGDSNPPPKPNKWIDQYSFKTDIGTQYKAYVEKVKPEGEDYLTYEVSFKATSPVGKPGANDFYKEVNDPKNMYRVMATVLAAVKESMAEDKENGEQVKSIKIEPTKNSPNDERRKKFYKAIIQKNMPYGSVIDDETDEDVITVYLPN